MDPWSRRNSTAPEMLFGDGDASPAERSWMRSSLKIGVVSESWGWKDIEGQDGEKCSGGKGT